ncbi:MAG: cache domain-containing protein [Gemmatimonadota bacterium]|nr:cache domain-containing protein [Gemmatimonadota bacterium]MDE2984795.1 cache domain-containing protein [Gemmatimonadota bacterium]
MSRSAPVLLTLLVFALAAPSPHPAHAQVEKVTAAEVVDKETLRKFILWAESVMSQIDDINEGAELLQEVRTEGSDYNSGNMYVILFTTEGHVFIHGEDPNIDGKLVVNVQDDQGTHVVQSMLSTGAQDGGGFVEWCWDDPADAEDVFCKDSYAIQYFSPVANVDFVLVGGYYQDLTHAGEPLPEVPLPAVGAADVVDRETLRQFVNGSLEWLVELLDLVGFARANEWKAVLREEGGHFKAGPIYLFIFTPEAYVLFHGANPWREGRYAEDFVDINGTRFVELIIEAAQAGGGFVEYFWDDPTVEGDEDTGSPKVSYALSFTSDYDFYPGQEFIIGAGFYRNFSTAEAEQAAEDWLHRFSRSVASQAMEMIGNRVSHAYHAEDHVEVGGQSLDFGALRGVSDPSDGQAMSYLGSLLARAGAGARHGNGARISPSAFLSTNSLLDGTSFQVSPGASGDGQGYSLWGGGEMMRFSNEQGEGFGNGEVMTAALGADYSLGSVIAGLAVTHSRGSGRFELGRPGDDDFGDITTTLTSGFPYARLALGDRLFTWGVLGYGSGNLNIEGGGEQDPESPISMRMGGVGLKAELVHSEDSGDFELAVRSDAFTARMTSEEVEGRRELTTNASRVRVMLEGSTGMAMGSSTMRPQLRVAMRYDGGDSDIDTGMGMEVGGGVSIVNVDRGLTIRVHGRRLMVHEQDEYDEWGLGGSLSLNPGGGGRGLSFGVRPTWGSTATSAAQLWALGATAMAPGGQGFGPGRRGLDAEVGYGIETPQGRGIFTPYARFVMSESLDAAWLGAGGLTGPAGAAPVTVANHGVYGYRLGSRLSLGRGLAAGIEAGRGTGPRNRDGAYRATVNLFVRW